MWTATWLHDVLEDTDTSEEELINKFGENVCKIVWSLTDGNRSEKKHLIKYLIKMKIEEIYQVIAQSIVDSIDADWEKSILRITYTGSSIEYNLGYWDNNPIEKDSDYNGGYEIMTKIEELHKITIDGGNNIWNRIEFKLTSDGEMNLEFIWDQELFDELERLSKE